MGKSRSSENVGFDFWTLLHLVVVTQRSGRFRLRSIFKDMQRLIFETDEKSSYFEISKAG